MPGPYPLATLAPTITSAGITAPVFEDILLSLQAIFQNIYGSDINLDNSTQDGQLIGVLANIINDSNSAAVTVYNQYSPATATGAALSSIVKTNGIQREVPSSSTAPMLLVGQPFTVIVNGVVEDEQQYQWSLPVSVEIGANGQVNTTATCLTQGAITAPAGTINTIVTPTYGWQTAINTVDATIGAPVESDGALRQRQSISVALPSQTPMAAIVAAVANCKGVTRVQPYENNTGGVDPITGAPGHYICIVVEGGQAADIATAIKLKKPPGVPTFGSTGVFVVDSVGIPQWINFQIANPRRLIAQLTLTPLGGFVATTKAAIAQAMSNWVAALPIGGNSPEGVSINDLVASAKLPPPLGSTYKITYGSMMVGAYGTQPSASDFSLNFADSAYLNADDVTILP